MLEKIDGGVKKVNRQGREGKDTERAKIERMAKIFQSLDRAYLELLLAVTHRLNAPDLSKPNETETIHKALGQALDNLRDQEIYNKVLEKKGEEVS